MTNNPNNPKREISKSEKITLSIDDCPEKSQGYVKDCSECKDRDFPCPLNEWIKIATED